MDKSPKNKFIKGKLKPIGFIPVVPVVATQGQGDVLGKERSVGMGDLHLNESQQTPEQSVEQPQNLLDQAGTVMQSMNLPGADIVKFSGKMFTPQTQDAVVQSVQNSVDKIKQGAELRFKRDKLDYRSEALGQAKMLNGLAGLSLLPVNVVSEILKQNPVTDEINNIAMTPFTLADQLYTGLQNGTDFAIEQLTGKKPDKNDPLYKELDELGRLGTQIMIGGKIYHEGGKLVKSSLPNMNQEPIKSMTDSDYKKQYEKAIDVQDEQLKSLGSELSKATTKEQIDEIDAKYSEVESKKKKWQQRLDELKGETKETTEHKKEIAKVEKSVYESPKKQEVDLTEKPKEEKVDWTKTDDEGNVWTAKATNKSKTSNYDIYKNGERQDIGARKIRDIEQTIEGIKESEQAKEEFEGLLKWEKSGRFGETSHDLKDYQVSVDPQFDQSRHTKTNKAILTIAKKNPDKSITIVKQIKDYDSIAKAKRDALEQVKILSKETENATDTGKQSADNQSQHKGADENGKTSQTGDSNSVIGSEETQKDAEKEKAVGESKLKQGQRLSEDFNNLPEKLQHKIIDATTSDGWRNNEKEVAKIKNAIRELVPDEAEAEKVFEAVKKKWEGYDKVGEWMKELKPKEKLSSQKSSQTEKPVKDISNKESQPKFRIGKSPQTYSLIERLLFDPKTDLPDEKYVRVKNDKTGETFTSLESDLTPVKVKTEVLSETDKKVARIDKQISQIEKKAGKSEIAQDEARLRVNKLKTKREGLTGEAKVEPVKVEQPEFETVGDMSQTPDKIIDSELKKLNTKLANESGLSKADENLRQTLLKERVKRDLPDREHTYNDAKQTIKDALKKDSGISLGGLSKLSDLSDPKVLKAVYDVSKYHFENGAKSIKEFTKKMVEDLGVWVKPHIRGLFDRAKGESDLIARHNTFSNKLKFADEIGGIANPSLAITKRGMPFEKFGDITLVADKSMIDPASKRSRVFGADVYSPRYPSIKAEYDRAKFKELNDKVYQTYIKHRTSPEWRGKNALDAENFKEYNKEALYRDQYFRIYYLDEIAKEKNVDFEDYDSFDNAIKKHENEYRKFIDDTFADITSDKKIFKGFTYSGNRRYAPLTLENLSKELKTNLRGGENFNYGVGSLRSKVAPEFKKINDIAKAKDKLVSSEKFDEIKRDIDQEFWDLVDTFAYDREGSSFGRGDAFIDIVSDAIRRKKSIVNELAEFGFKDGDNQKLFDFLGKLKTLPTEYFESIITRPVKIGEFKSAVVPQNVSAEVLDILKQNGIEDIRKYKDAEERQKIVEGMDEHSFGSEVGYKDYRKALDRLKPPFDRSQLTQQGVSINLKPALDKTLEIGKKLWDSYSKPPQWTDAKNAMGKLTGADNLTAFTTRRLERTIQKAIPDLATREAITNYIQAEGDLKVLQDRADKSTGKLKTGYEKALNLSPKQIKVAEMISEFYDAKLQEGLDNGLLKEGIENYVNQQWKTQNPVGQKLVNDFSGTLNTNFKNAKQRIFESYFEGEQKGYEPLTKDISKLVGIYNDSFGKAINSRNFVKNMIEGKGKDGRPLVATTGFANPIGEKGDTILVKPFNNPEKSFDYKNIDHPALRNWKWATTVDNKTVLMQGNLAVHPEAFDFVNNALKPSSLNKSGVVKGLTKFQSNIKALGFALSPFHIVQEARHGVGHMVNPAGKLDVFDPDSPEHQSYLNHGLQLYDYKAMNDYREGFTSNIVDKIPVAKEIANFTFEKYIPSLKLRTAEHIVERNTKRYKGRLTKDQILALSMEQTNAAYGHLNYKLMGRNPTLQHGLRLLLLAPDFLEARARFVGQALKPYGMEQRRALGVLMATGYVTARIMNKLLDDDYHFDLPFTVLYKGQEYGLRDVPADVYHLVTEPRRFTTARMSPLLSLAFESLTGKDYKGTPIDFTDNLKDFAMRSIPMTLKATGDQNVLDSFLSSMGLRNKKYYTPIQHEILEKYYEANPPHKLTTTEQERKDFYKELDKAKDNPKELKDKVSEGIDKGIIKPRDMDKFLNAKDNIDEAMFKSLDKERQMEIAKNMSDEELQVYAPYMKTDVAKEYVDKFKDSYLKSDTQAKVYEEELKVIREKFRSATDTQKQELRTRAKEVNDKLQELKKTDELKQKQESTNAKSKETRQLNEELGIEKQRKSKYAF